MDVLNTLLKSQFCLSHFQTDSSICGSTRVGITPGLHDWTGPDEKKNTNTIISNHQPR